MSDDDKVFIDPTGHLRSIEEVRERITTKAKAVPNAPDGAAIVVVGPQGATGLYLPYVLTAEECQAIGLVLVSLASSMSTSSGVEAVINALKAKDDALAKGEPVPVVRPDRNKLN